MATKASKRARPSSVASSRCRCSTAPSQSPAASSSRIRLRREGSWPPSISSAFLKLPMARSGCCSLLRHLADLPVGLHHLQVGELVAVVDDDGGEDAQRLLELPLRHQQVAQPLQRRQVGGVELVGAPVAPQRLVALPELLGHVALPVALPAELLGVAAALQGADDGVEHPRRVRPALQADVEVGERPGRRQVVGLALERLLVGAHRALAVVALLLVDPPHLGPAVGPLLVVLGVARLGGEQLQVAVAVPLALGDPLHGPERRQAARVERQRLAVGLLGRGHVEEHVLLDGADADVDVDRVAAGAGDARLALQHVERQVPVAAPLVEPPQRRDRLARLGVELDGLVEDGLGPVDARHLLPPDLADGHHQRHLLLAVGEQLEVVRRGR